MTEEYNAYQKAREVMNRFSSSQERMRSSPLFHTIIQTLIRNDNPYQVIEQLINATEDAQKALSMHLLRNPPQYIITTQENFEKVRQELEKKEENTDTERDR